MRPALSTLRPPAVDTPKAKATDDAAYQPGVCNIGTAEIGARRRAGIVGAAATVALLGVLLAVRAPRATRLLIAVPAAGAASGFVQARHRFCAAYGTTGVFNTTGALGDVSAVEDPASRALDRAAARRIGRTSALVGLAAAALVLGLPPWRRAGD